MTAYLVHTNSTDTEKFQIPLITCNSYNFSLLEEDKYNSSPLSAALYLSNQTVHLKCFWG